MKSNMNNQKTYGYNLIKGTPALIEIMGENCVCTDGYEVISLCLYCL